MKINSRVHLKPFSNTLFCPILQKQKQLIDLLDNSVDKKEIGDQQ